MVKKAAALTNKSLGALPADVADAIIWACDEVLDHGRCLDQFPVDVFQGGAGTSLNMNTNEVIANLALEHLGHPKGSYDIVNPNDHVNRSQSTNDAYPCGFRLAVVAMVADLEVALTSLADAFGTKGEEFTDILKMGRTQLQDAVPMTLGQEFSAFGVTLGEELRHLDNARSLLLEMNLGATAIGTGLNTPPGYAPLAVAALARVSAQPCIPAPNLIEATSDCGAYVMTHAALKRLAMKLSKICNDLRLLSSGPRAGLNEINLPEVQAGSSISDKVGLIKDPVMGRDQAIIAFMLTIAAVTVLLARSAPSDILTASTFKSGMSAAICVLGVAWLGTTFVQAYTDDIKGVAGQLLADYPWMLAVVLFFAAALLYSQAATTKALMPTALALGVAPLAAVAAFPAVSALFVLPTYPTLLAAVEMDDTGSTRIGKAVFNHAFLVPGILTISFAVILGFLFGSLVI